MAEDTFAERVTAATDVIVKEAAGAAAGYLLKNEIKKALADDPAWVAGLLRKVRDGATWALDAPDAPGKP